MGLVVGITFLIIFSAVTPMVIGFDNVETSDNELMDDLTFVCSYDTDYSKVSYYREYLFDIQSVEGCKSEELTIPIKSLTAVSSTGPMDSPWPMFGHDSCHTGRSPFGTEDNPGVEIWRFYSGHWVEDTPIIDSDGTIYFGGGHDEIPYYLYAVHPNGTLKWRYYAGENIWDSSPAIDENGTIYVGSWDNYLHAINPDGTLKWKLDCKGNIASSPVIADDGTIYFGTMRGFDKGDIYAVNPNGTKKWYYETGYYIVSDPAIGDDGTIYIGSGDTYFYALYPNGTLRWKYKTDDIIKASASIADDGTVYVNSWDDYLYAFYPNNGTVKWKFKMNNGGYEGSPAIGSDGTIYVGGYEKIYSFNPNGTIKWTFPLDSENYIHKSSIALSSEDILYVGTEKGEILSLNPDGTERWRKKIARDWIASSPSIGADGTVYVGSSSHDIRGYEIYGFLHAFNDGIPNNIPSTPMISGPQSGKAGDTYEYTFQSWDPDGEDIFYYVNWNWDGDSTWAEWYGPYPSGELVRLNYSWSFEGTFKIKALARDTFGEDSDLSTLKVTMPKNRAINFNSLFYWFSENHLRMFFPLLRHILGL